MSVPLLVSVWCLPHWEWTSRVMWRERKNKVERKSIVPLPVEVCLRGPRSSSMCPAACTLSTHTPALPCTHTGYVVDLSQSSLPKTGTLDIWHRRILEIRICHSSNSQLVGDVRRGWGTRVDVPSIPVIHPFINHSHTVDVMYI